jgi:hypothetical protein
MAPRKKPVPVQDIERPPEPPVIANDAPPLPVTPVNVTPVRVERPAARPSSKGGKGGGKSSGGKGSSSKTVRVGGGGHSQTSAGHKPKKKRAKKRAFKGLMVKNNNFLGDRKYGSKKKTTKRTPSKPGLRKRP